MSPPSDHRGFNITRDDVNCWRTEGVVAALANWNDGYLDWTESEQMEVGRPLKKSRDNVLEETANMTHEIRRAILSVDAGT